MKKKLNKIKLIISVTLLLLNGCGGGGEDGDEANSPSALCNDGTYSYSQSCTGTCSSHGGVATWYNSCGGSTPIGGGSTPPPTPYLRLDVESWNNAKWR